MRQRVVNRMLQRRCCDGIISGRDEDEKRRSEYRVQAELEGGIPRVDQRVCQCRDVRTKISELNGSDV